MTPTFKQMIKEKKGYRTENYSGSGVRDVYDIIRYELSMGNTDIVRYVQHNYSILSDYTLDEDWISEEEKQEILSKEGEKGLKEAEEEDFSEMCMLNSPNITNEIIDYIEEQLGDSYYGLWLTTFQKVIERYNESNTKDIDEYIIRQPYLVLSDLGGDGALFVFKK